MDSWLITSLTTLAGVILGSAATTIGARSGARRNWNLDQLKEERVFHSELLAATYDQLTMLRNFALEIVKVAEKKKAEVLRQDPEATKFNFHHDFTPAQVERLQNATQRWRTMMAKRVIYSSPEISKIIEELDRARSVATESLNIGRPDKAEAALDGFEKVMAKLNTEFRKASLQNNALLVQELHPWRGRRKIRKELKAKLQEVASSTEK